MGRRLAFLLLVIIISSQVFADSKWVEVKSAHFTVLTEGGEKQGREIALRFEQMRAFFGTIFHKAKVNVPVPLEIIALKNQGQIKEYAPLWKGKPVQLAGFYIGGGDSDFIVLDMSSTDPYSVVFHEYAHLLLHANLPTTPPWFDEGFADYYSSLKITNKTVEFGNVPEGAPETLQQQKWMPLAALLGVQHDSAEYNEGNKRTIFYAQSWITVHYLLTNQKIPETFKFLQLSQVEKVPISDAVKQAFGMEITALEKTIHNYFSGNQGKYYRMDAPVVDAGDFSSKKVDDLTARAMLADLHAHSKDYEGKATLELEEILQRDPANLVANRALGYLYLRQNKFENATALFEKAAASDTKDAQIHYLNALLMNRVAMKQGKPPDKPEFMQQELEKAIDLDPTMADAYNLLAYALAAQRKFEPAIAAQKRAIELNQSMELYQVNLAGLYMQSEMWDNAEGILARLAQSSDPQVKEMASQNLAALQSRREFAAEQSRMKELRRGDITAPQWRPKEGQSAPTVQDMDDSPKPDTRKVLYLYGRLQSVDCSSDPVAVLAVQSGAKLMKLRAENYKKLLVMGADEFSCNWKNQKVLVNYKPGGKADGDIVTLEVQNGK